MVLTTLISRPSFDPNAFAVKIERAEWNKLITDPDHPLMNKAIQAQLAPGSTFKILMSVAGLQEGIAQTLKVNCAGGWGPYGFFHHCDEHHGAVDIHNAIPFSCDTYYYQLGDRLGIDRISKYATEFGYGQKTGIDLPNEQPGLMPSARWLMKNYHRRWYPDETLDVAGLYTVRAGLDTRLASGKPIGLTTFDGVALATDVTLVRVRRSRPRPP